MKCTDPYTVIFGCGNVLLGDDGFGPAVIESLNSTAPLPADVLAVDAGTGVREYLLDYLLDPATTAARIILVDAMDTPGTRPGTLQERDPSAIPAEKIHDFSLHQFPTVNLLRELALETRTRVTLLTAQVESVPATVRPGLSTTMTAAVPSACRSICRMVPSLQSKKWGGYEL